MKKIKKISVLLLAMAGLITTASCELSFNSTPSSNEKTPESDSTKDDGNGSKDSTPEGQGTTPGGNQDTTTKYEVTFNTNGGTSVTTQTVESGKTISNVSTTKSGCVFGGWYTNAELTNQFDTTTPITGKTTLYAKWNVTVTFVTNSGTAVSPQTIKEGSTISAVSTTRNGYNFDGWYTNAALTTAFNTNSTINTSLTLYAKWRVQSTEGNILTNYSAYNEGAFVEFSVANSSAANNSIVSYSTDSINWTAIDSQLIRYNSSTNTARADIVGLKSGSYLIKVNNTVNESTTPTLNVSAEDRSGYAHFGHSNSIGAYKSDGTLKDNAVVVYVNEANKNSVQATFGGKTYSGLYNILKNSSESYPLDIRIIGTIGAPTLVPTNLVVTKLADKKHDVQIKNSSGTTLSSTTNQSDLISGGYATLDNSYPELNGLTSKVIKDDPKTYNGTTYNTFDSYYNMMDISSKKNITIEGLGTDATIDQWGFTWKNCSYIEVKNLTFSDYTEDACSFEASDTSATSISGFKTGYIWVHNNTFNIGKNNFDVSYEQDKHEGDGATDFKGLRNVTISYNHYYKNHKTGLVGGDGTHHQANFTFHHNWYHENQARLPYGRQANMHMYNNFYDSSTGNNMQIHDGGYAFIENCYFKNTAKTFEVKTNKTTLNPAIKSYNNVYDNCGNYNIDKVTITTDRTATVANDNFISSTFDTNSSLFYYDSTNKKSDVAIMNSANELPTLIPTIAGAGILANFGLGTFNDINTNVEKFTVTFETNGGSSVAPQTVASGSTISSVSTTRSGYSFMGWYTNPGLTDSFTLTTPITRDIKLYAKWQESTDTALTFNDFETGVISSETSSNGLTIQPKSGKTAEIKNCSSTQLGNYTVSKYISFNGGGSYSQLSAQFTITKTANITVYYAGSSGRATGLYNSDGLVEEATTKTIGTGPSNIVNYTYTNVSAGSYAIASTNSSIEVYAIIITY